MPPCTLLIGHQVLLDQTIVVLFQRGAPLGLAKFAAFKLLCMVGVAVGHDCNRLHFVKCGTVYLPLWNRLAFMTLFFSHYSGRCTASALYCLRYPLLHIKFVIGTMGCLQVSFPSNPVS